MRVSGLENGDYSGNAKKIEKHIRRRGTFMKCLQGGLAVCGFGLVSTGHLMEGCRESPEANSAKLHQPVQSNSTDQVPNSPIEKQAKQ